MKNKLAGYALASAALLLGASSPAVAQSSIQCTIGPGGKLEAALVWRNTLGAERANALCQSASATRAAPAAGYSMQANAGPMGLNPGFSQGYQPMNAARPMQEPEYVPLPSR